MLNVTFDEMNHSAAVSGAYQYDTGQRLRIYGLPTPDELAEEDELLSGELATVQVHFGMMGDSQTEARLALWKEDRGCWEAAVPDSYLQAAESVYAYVYIGYGMDAEGNGRTKTRYDLTFRPIARPAPNNVATDEQWEAWATKKGELELTVDALSTAAGSLSDVAAQAEAHASAANTAADTAEKAAQAAAAARQRLQNNEALWDGARIQTIDLAPEAEAYVTMEAGVLTLARPIGATGAQGAAGADGPTDIGLTFTDGILTITPK